MSATRGENLLCAHIGDLHVTCGREQNDLDFLAIVESINTNLAAMENYLPRGSTQSSSSREDCRRGDHR